MSMLPSPRSIFTRYERQGYQENILLVGTVGSGKSATINTISAVLSGEKLYRAPIGSLHGDFKKRTTTHLIWYKKCGIDLDRQKSLHVPKYFPNLVDMTGLADDSTKFQEDLLEMIMMGKIPDKTSIPALLDVQRQQGGTRALHRLYPFIYNRRRIHKILFVGSITEPVPKGLIECIRKIAQPDGSSSNLNPRYIPIFGILTKSDLVDWKDPEIKKREREFQECLGIDSIASYSQWKNSSAGEFTSGVIYFLDKLLSPGIKPVMDEVFCLKLLAGELWEQPRLMLLIPLVVVSVAVIFHICNPLMLAL